MSVVRLWFFALGPVAFALAASHSPSYAARTWVAPVAIGQDFSGVARVLDGDTLDVAETRVRLEGIDAPEPAQKCQHANGAEWACGREATRALQAMVDGRVVTCRNHGLEKYGRTLGTCFIDGRNLNAEMVKLGLAWAFVRYASTYVTEEAQAKAMQIGIWSGKAEAAWDFRARAWSAVAEEAPNGCAIKGNVTAGGRIYHMPWSPWYQRVRITGHTNKRWFCSEAEALEAGWRPAYARRLNGRAEGTPLPAAITQRALEK